MNLFRLKPRYVSEFRDGQYLDLEGASVRLRVNGRARRVSLRLDTSRREVIATAPSARRLDEAAAFAAERGAWVRAQLARLPEIMPVAPGHALEVLGRPCRLVSAPSRREAGLFEAPDGYELAAYGEERAFVRSAVSALRRTAQARLSERTLHYAGALDRAAPQITIVDPRSRWGSCRPPRAGDAGAVRYSWRLVLAPEEVADYVAAHECAHLVEANHGPRFWALVRAIYGSERTPRQWLKTHGPRLQGFARF